MAYTDKKYSRKIFNDPVHGFINISDELVFTLIEHPYFQRLRRIKQLGITHLVYPGALHTRFQHALGSMYLMDQAIIILRSKGHTITKEESQAALIAILLHDIGHGPFSHSLENLILENLDHEMISAIFMDKLNNIFDKKLSMALDIFNNNYSKKFLHQLVSSQLDVDRLDYLKRDSFFTGVSEGIIGTERIIKMLNILDDELVVEAKGIYSIESFIIARRIMYWQVYFHKTVIAAEHMLINIFKRAKQLFSSYDDLFTTPSLKFFMGGNSGNSDYEEQDSNIENFAKLDDFDIFTSIKVWSEHSDNILSTLCFKLLNRKLFKIEIQEKEFDEVFIKKIKIKTAEKYNIDMAEINYFVINKSISNNTYNHQSDKINILNKNGNIMDIAAASDQMNETLLSNTVVKYFLCYPKDCSL